MNQVDFVLAISMAWNAERPLHFQRDDGTHTRWTIWKAQIVEVTRGYAVALRGSGPDVDIQCERIDITTLDSKAVSVVNNTWWKPGAPLARPGLEALAARFLQPQGAKTGPQRR